MRGGAEWVESKTSKLIPTPPHGARLKSCSGPIKLYFLLICPTNITFFFLIKHVSLIKIYLKLQLNLSYQIKLIFSKNYVILSKCMFNKIISQQKQKSQSITNNKIEAESRIG